MAGPYNQATIVHQFTVGVSTAQVGYDVVIAPTDDDLNRVARRVHRALGSRFDNAMSISCSLERTIAKANGDQGEHSQQFLGQSPSLGAVCSTSFLVSKIPVQGPQGRLYLPGLSEQGVRAGGNLRPDYQETVQDRIDLWLDRLRAQGYDMVLRRPGGSLDLVQRLVLKRYAGRQDRRLVRSRV